MKPDIENAALLGGVEITVQTHDGEMQSVKVCALPLRLIPRYLELQLLDAEQEMAELFLQWESKAADVLTDDSIIAVVLEGEKLNFPRAEAFVARKEARITKVLPLLQRIEDILLANVAARVAPEIEERVRKALKASVDSPPARPLPSGPVTPPTSESKASPG